MNHVLTDGAGVVLQRSVAPIAPVDGFTVHETEAWPEIGSARAEDGTFFDPPTPLDSLKARKARAIDVEREARIAGGFTFGGVRYQSRAGDRENIAGAAQLAAMGMMLDFKQPGDLRWHGGDADFVWIAEDNSLTPMDAPTVIAFAKAAAEFKSACIFHARDMKDDADAAADEAALNAIDPASGWPA